MVGNLWHQWVSFEWVRDQPDWHANAVCMLEWNAKLLPGPQSRVFVTEKDLFEETLGAYPIVVNEVGISVEDSSIAVESVSSPVAKSVDGQDWYWN